MVVAHQKPEGTSDCLCTFTSVWSIIRELTKCLSSNLLEVCSNGKTRGVFKPIQEHMQGAHISVRPTLDLEDVSLH
jgi:hypothetical protein